MDPRETISSLPTLNTFKSSYPKVLDEVKSFLPQLKSANEKLQNEMARSSNPDKFNIEEISDCGGKIIKMDVALFEEYSSADDPDQRGDNILLDSDDDGDWSQITEKNIKFSKSERKCKKRPEIIDITSTIKR